MHAGELQFSSVFEMPFIENIVLGKIKNEFFEETDTLRIEVSASVSCIYKHWSTWWTKTLKKSKLIWRRSFYAMQLSKIASSEN